VTISSAGNNALKHYIIDGNNLIGKMKSLMSVQKKDKQGAREKLVILLDSYFHEKKAVVSLHLDGFAGESLRSSKLRIHYSGKKTADEKIKEQIDKSDSRRNIILVTSDNNLAQYAKLNSCEIISAESFSLNLSGRPNESDEEKKRIDELNNPEEFKRLFGAK
jgi:predicted RNA-binding protein with PIN domain